MEWLCRVPSYVMFEIFINECHHDQTVAMRLLPKVRANMFKVHQKLGETFFVRSLTLDGLPCGHFNSVGKEQIEKGVCPNLRLKLLNFLLTSLRNHRGSYTLLSYAIIDAQPRSFFTSYYLQINHSDAYLLRMILIQTRP